MKPIAIFGFGRSGTTWLSDIVSKTLGGLILFEPYFPGAWHRSEEFCYNYNLDEEVRNIYLSQILACYSKQNTNSWLLRNHIGQNPREFSQSFVDEIWKNCDVIGFKSIRCSHCISFFRGTHQCVYIVRHPLAVISSITNRSRFYLEFGWEFHINKFREISKTYRELELIQGKLVFSLDEKMKTIASMWTITQIISLSRFHEDDYLLFYEDLYRSPYAEISKLIESISNTEAKIHPSYIFTPSMVTLKTKHSNQDKNFSEFKNDQKHFWKGTIDDNSAYEILEYTYKLLSCYPKVLKTLKPYFGALNFDKANKNSLVDSDVKQIESQLAHEN